MTECCVCMSCDPETPIEPCSVCKTVVHRKCLDDWQEWQIDEVKRNKCMTCKEDLKPEFFRKPCEKCIMKCKALTLIGNSDANTRMYPFSGTCRMEMKDEFNDVRLVERAELSMLALPVLYCLSTISRPEHVHVENFDAAFFKHLQEVPLEVLKPIFYHVPQDNRVFIFQASTRQERMARTMNARGLAATLEKEMRSRKPVYEMLKTIRARHEAKRARLHREPVS